MANSRKMDTTSAEEIFYLNKRFDSYEELSLARSTFEKSRFTQLCVKDSRTIEGNKNRCTKKKYNEKSSMHIFPMLVNMAVRTIGKVNQQECDLIQGK